MAGIPKENHATNNAAPIDKILSKAGILFASTKLTPQYNTPHVIQMIQLLFVHPLIVCLSHSALLAPMFLMVIVKRYLTAEFPNTMALPRTHGKTIPYAALANTGEAEERAGEVTCCAAKK